MRTTSISNNVFQSFYKDREIYKEHLKTSPMVHQAPKKDHKALIAGAAFLCSIAPVIALNIKKGNGTKLLNTFKDSASTLKDKAKSVFKMIEIEEFPEIFTATTGAVLGGTLTGIMTDKNPNNRTAKLKEGSFEFLNAMTPTVIAAGLHTIAQKTGKFTSPVAKAAGIVGSVTAGMFIANKATNKLNEKVFDKGSEEKTKRKFKPTDCLVHLDDALSLLVITKVPFAKSIHLDKVLPLLYARAGYEAGSSKKEITSKM